MRNVSNFPLRPFAIADLLAEPLEYSPATMESIRAFARSKPWRGTPEERKAKFQEVNDALCEASGVKVGVLFGELHGGDSSLDSRYCSRQRTIYLAGKLSVVTYLHLFAKAIGLSQLDCFRWSIGLFAACFPRSFAACRQEGLYLRK